MLFLGLYRSHMFLLKAGHHLPDSKKWHTQIIRKCFPSVVFLVQVVRSFNLELSWRFIVSYRRPQCTPSSNDSSDTLFLVWEVVCWILFLMIPSFLALRFFIVLCLRENLPFTNNFYSTLVKRARTCQAFSVVLIKPVSESLNHMFLRLWPCDFYSLWEQV